MHSPIESNGYVVAIDEHRAILKRCRECLLEAYRAATLPVEPIRWAGEGWSYSWDVLRRDRQGNALVMIRVFNPDKVKVMSRRYRFVREQRLPRSLTSEWRGAL